MKYNIYDSLIDDFYGEYEKKELNNQTNFICHFCGEPIVFDSILMDVNADGEKEAVCDNCFLNEDVLCEIFSSLTVEEKQALLNF